LRNSCVLSDIIVNDAEKKRFILASLRNKIEKHCLGLDKNSFAPSLCYNNKFLGPFKDKSKVDENGKKFNDFFFISVFESDKIQITDFSYEIFPNFMANGHIFGLFYHERVTFNNSSNTYMESSPDILLENVKYLKNIGSAIQKVLIVKDGENEFNYLNNGILIQYSEGDECLKDKSKNLNFII
jgi:hypothetical protein